MRKKILSVLMAFALVFVGFIVPSQKAYAAEYTHITEADYTAATFWSGISDYSRLAAVLDKASRGEKITIVTLGGSITQGVISPGPDELIDVSAKPYATIVKDWFVEKFPDAKIKFYNAGVGGTGSYYGVHRLNRDVLVYNPDLVLVEFAVNDYSESYFDAVCYENIVRRLLEYKDNLAVMLLFSQTTDGISEQGYQSTIGSNFKVPMISYGNAINYAMANEGKSPSDFSGDKTHPSIFGHQFYGELICKNLDHINMIKNTFDKPVAFDYEMLSYEAFSDARTIPWPEIGKVGDDGVMRFGVEASEIGIYWDLTDMSSYTEFDVYVDDQFVNTITFDYEKITHTGPFDQIYYGTDGYHTVEIKPNTNVLDYTIGINQVFVCNE